MDCEEDEQALTQIKRFFPAYARKNRIAQVDSLDIVKEGGAMKQKATSIILANNEYFSFKRNNLI